MLRRNKCHSALARDVRIMGSDGDMRQAKDEGSYTSYIEKEKKKGRSPARHTLPPSPHIPTIRPARLCMLTAWILECGDMRAKMRILNSSASRSPDSYLVCTQTQR